MSAELDMLLRGPQAFELARKALEAMEAQSVWPTALNFELWLHYVSGQDSGLVADMDQILSRREAFTETVAEALAASHLPKARLNGELLNAGQALSNELATVSKAIESARETNEAYGAELATASQTMEAEEPTVIKTMVATLADATQRVQRENRSLETKLADTTAEVTRLREHLETVRREAMTDGLTQLANRRAFDEALEDAVTAHDAQGEPLTLAVIDIDHFKHFNDTWGHRTGDQVLRYVASVISRAGGVMGRTAARYGGEEFAIIFPQEDASQAMAVAEEIRNEVASRMLKRRSTNEDLGAVTISIGVAERRRGEGQGALVERADAALYASKRSGRNRTTCFEDIPAAA